MKAGVYAPKPQPGQLTLYSRLQYLLRWRFDFLDGKVKCGMWSTPATNMVDMAFYNNRGGIVRAAIEGKHIHNRNTVVLCECDGHEFVKFDWIGAARYSFKDGKTANHPSIGLAMKTRDHIVEVYGTGEAVLKERSEADKKFHYESYGR